MPLMCGLAKHPLQGEGVYLTEATIISFVRKTRVDFRPDDKICEICKNTVEAVYKEKLKRAKQLRHSRRQGVTTISSLSNSMNSTDSMDRLVLQSPLHITSRRESNISSVSESSSLARLCGSSELYTQEDINGNVEKLNGSIGNENNKSLANYSELSTSPEQTLPPTVVRKDVKSNSVTSALKKYRTQLFNDTIASPTVYTEEIISKDTSHIRLSQEPTTSKATNVSLRLRLSQEPTTSSAAVKAAEKSEAPKQTAAAKAVGIRDYFKPLQVNGNNHSDTTPTPNVSSSKSASSGKRNLSKNLDKQHKTADEDDDDSEDDEPLMSLNYYNPDVRRPDIQPIPKKRRFHHDNPDIMDIYIQGLHGG